jgi:hypothetical protein
LNQSTIHLILFTATKPSYAGFKKETKVDGSRAHRNPMVSQLVKTFHGGSKCCLPVVLWSLAAWVLLLQAYTSLLRLPSHVPEPYSQWNNASHMFYRDAAEQTAEQLDAEMIENLDDNAQEKVEKVEKWNKLEENEDLEETFGAVAPVEPATTAKALEESKELLAQRRLAFLFPGKTSVIDPSKVNGSEYGYFYPGRTWLDSVGKPIQAHGGGVMYVAETQTFYWYGENKNGATIHPKQGTARVSSFRFHLSLPLSVPVLVCLTSLATGL